MRIIHAQMDRLTLGTNIEEPMAMEKQERKEVRKQLNALAWELVYRFRTGARLIDGLEVQVKMRALPICDLQVIAHAARQIRDLGVAAENLLAKRSAEGRKQWKHQRDAKAFTVVRELSQRWIAEGVDRSVRLERVAELGKVKT